MVDPEKMLALCGDHGPLARQQTKPVIERLCRVINAAMKFYDEMNPVEDGHDQVYPWDNEWIS